MKLLAEATEESRTWFRKYECRCLRQSLSTEEARRAAIIFAAWEDLDKVPISYEIEIPVSYEIEIPAFRPFPYCDPFMY
jgi:hypothetical protein